MDKENSKREVQKLIEKYDNVVKENRVNIYNEEMTKKDFILPLFRNLGWDTENSTEVTAEEKISKKRVDYGFRINGIPKFMLEAKKLKGDIINTKYVEQAIDYSWNKGCTWAVLTNFESIIIFNAEWKGESLWHNRYKTIESKEFLQRFDELWLLSRESFEQNLIDIEAEKVGKKVKRISVDKQLLSDFTRFRELLSKNIIKLNQKKSLSELELDESVQRVLDRLIFIRNCEDRELEPRILISNYREWSSRGKGQLIRSLRETFLSFDKQYNSKIFAEHLCDDLDIDNDVLQEIIEGLYYTKDKSISYDFSVIDADVLGTVYEQYLSHILKKTEKRATLTENHIHRKEQGIYYTPSYIVNYIVKNTLGTYINKNNFEKIKILDPACGSGSFLIKAYDLLNEYYSKNDKDYHQAELDFKTDVIFPKKSKILQNNIFGVDLDKQAVEIAQLNLLLKIAEKKKRLPILEQNIKCGNSIIDDLNIAGIHAFNWNVEFKEIIENGGFDVIIGNPPYGAELNEIEKDYISNRFKYASSNKNTALIFIEKSLELLKDKGYFGMIVPKSLAFSQVWNSGRELIKDNLIKVVDVSKAFEDVLLEQMIIILSKSRETTYYTLEDIYSGENININKKYIESTDSIILHEDVKDFKIFEKMNLSSKYLSDITKTSRGLPLQKYLIKEKTKYPIIRGKNISRYNYRESEEYLPDELIARNNNKVKFLQQPKIISQRIVAHVTKPKDHIIIMSAIDNTLLLTVDTVENTILTDKTYSLEFVLCLLNSILISWYAYRYIFSKAIRTMDFDNYYIGKIPIPNIKIENNAFINLVNKRLSINKRLKEIGNKKTDERNRIQEEIKNIDHQIDDLVYTIYGITEDEKEIIESSLK